MFSQMTRTAESLFHGGEKSPEDRHHVDPSIFTDDGWAHQIKKAQNHCDQYRCMKRTRDGKLASFPMHGENSKNLVYYGCSVATSLYLQVLKIFAWAFVVMFVLALPAMATNYERSVQRSACRDASRTDYEAITSTTPPAGELASLWSACAWGGLDIRQHMASEGIMTTLLRFAPGACEDYTDANTAITPIDQPPFVVTPGAAYCATGEAADTSEDLEDYGDLLVPSASTTTSSSSVTSTTTTAAAATCALLALLPPGDRRLHGGARVHPLQAGDVGQGGGRGRDHGGGLRRAHHRPAQGRRRRAAAASRRDGRELHLPTMGTASS